MADINEPAAGGSGGSDNTPLSQRRIFGSKRLASPPPTERPDLEEKLASLVDSVKVLRDEIKGGVAEPTSEINPKDGNARRYKRVQRPGEDAAASPEGDASTAEPGDAESAINQNIAWPRVARAADAPAGRNLSFGQRYPFLIWIAVNVAGLALLMAGYWLGQSSAEDEAEAERTEATPVSKTVPVTSLTRMGINDRAMEAADTALHAEKAGDVVAARQTYEAAVNQSVRLPGAEYRLAMLDIQRGDFTAADIHLERSLAEGEMMAACYFVNAALSGKDGRYTDAARQLAGAVRVEPFNAKYLFCLGEALRRAGKIQDGIAALERARQRPAAPRDLELFDFKLRLAKAESLHDDAFNTELATQLQQSKVTGDWLLLAAAQDLAKGAYPGAAQHLQAAQRALPPESYNLWVQDYFFQQYAAHPEVTALLRVPAPPTSTVPMDPGAWQCDEADPAVWPPFPSAS